MIIMTDQENKRTKTTTESIFDLIQKRQRAKKRQDGPQ